MDDLLQRVRSGERRAVARALTQVERNEELAREIVARLYPFTGHAHIVGVTGAPGTGKSTLVNRITRAIRERGVQVGIIAVDPSSPFTGGALLGDRVRMQDLAGDDGVFIRSMASRGNLGGLARATTSAVKILDAAGFDIILIETVGAGQDEVSIASAAHTTIVVEAPGLGDEIQSIKAGILEIADILVVNKADRPGAANTTKSLRLMLHMGHENRKPLHHGSSERQSAGNGTRREGAENHTWKVGVFETVAVTGEGVEDVVEAIVAHREYLQGSGDWFEREMERSRQEIEQLLQLKMAVQMEATVSKHEREALVSAVARRQVDPYTAASRLYAQLFPDC